LQAVRAEQGRRYRTREVRSFPEQLIFAANLKFSCACIRRPRPSPPRDEAFKNEAGVIRRAAGLAERRELRR
jgi:hypothetical protein